MSPSILLGLLLGSIYGLLCHAFVGRRWRQLPVYWGAGIAGFFGGFAAAALIGIDPLRLGAVPLLGATLGSCVALAVVRAIVGWRADDRLREAR